LVLNKESLAIVEADRPEPVHGYVLYGECIRRLAVVLFRNYVEVGGIDPAPLNESTP
jgi:hypothetical protein